MGMTTEHRQPAVDGLPVAVVTGSGAGIGAAVARGLAADGYTVAVLDLDEASAGGTVDRIEQAGGQAAAFSIDVSDDDSVLEVARAVNAKLGPAKVLVNNAGWDEIRPFIETDAAFRAKVLNVNLRGAISVSHSFLESLIQTGGRVVNVSSDAGRVGSSGETVYAGAKAGIIGFTKSLAREVARHGVTVNCVCPGPTATAFFDKNPEKLREALIRAIPLRRLAEPEDVWHAIRFFASPEASYITGQILSVSGGLTMNG